jgi:SAM-dependent methyltransferase
MFSTITCESELAAAGFALVTSPQNLTHAEFKLARGNPALPSPALIDRLRHQILSRGDPLGDLFCKLRSQKDRRSLGAVYTPTVIVESILRWAANQPFMPARVIDPGAGTGRFLLAAAKFFPHAKLFAVEIDPLPTLLLRANASVLGVADRITFVNQDYRSISLEKILGPTLFVGNPPYVRHHAIENSWKNWFATSAAKFGHKASKLAGLHVHFFMKTLTLAQTGDFGAFVTSSEWLDVNYGSLLRKLLTSHLGGIRVSVFQPDLLPFSGAMTTSAITTFKLGWQNESFILNSATNLESVDDMESGVAVSRKELASQPKWSQHLHGLKNMHSAGIELGELFRVHRGQVTGLNQIWIESAETPKIPDRFLYPAVTRGRELTECEGKIASKKALRRVIDLPQNLEALTPKERTQVEEFLEWAANNGATNGFVARNRKAWWSVGLREPAPILCSYMARRQPVFVVNDSGVRHLNIAHGLYPRKPMSNAILAAVAEYLNGNTKPGSGRTYAGGLIKFEPKEIERLEIPRLDELPVASG